MRPGEDETARATGMVAVDLGVGSLVAGASASGSVRVWNAETGQLLTTITDHCGTDVVLAFTLDGKELATSSSVDPLRIWNAETGALKVVCQFNGGKQAVSRTLVPAGNGQSLYSGSPSALWINRWSLETGKIQGGHFGSDESGITALTLMADGQSLYSGSANGWVTQWESGYSDASQAFETFRTGAILAIAVSANGDEILTVGDRDRTACAWDTRGTLLHTFDAEPGPVSTLALDRNRDELLLGRTSGQIESWHRARRERLSSFSGHAGAVHALSVSVDGDRFASASADGTVGVWARDTAEPIHRLE